jgi:hypothetical protein
MRALHVLIGVLYGVGFFVGLCCVTYCIDAWLLGGLMEGYAMNEFLRMPVRLLMACVVGAAGAYFHSNNIGTACGICRWGGLTLLVGICTYVCWLDLRTPTPTLDLGDFGFMWGECIVAAILMMCAPRAIEWWDWRRLRTKGWIMPAQDPGAWPPSPVVRDQSHAGENLGREAGSKRGPHQPSRFVRPDGDVLGRGDGREHLRYDERDDAEPEQRPPL